MRGDSALTVAVLLPDLLGTYGDAGNAEVLTRRAQWRGIPTRTIRVTAGQAVPANCDIYLLGGGEDRAQAQATHLLAASCALTRAVSSGAAVLAVCAGLQILGRYTTDGNGHRYPGLDILDLTTAPGPRRAVGHVVTCAEEAVALADPVLIGFENHAGRTTLGPGVAPLGSVRTGIGNGDGGDGVATGNIIGTYLHGPVLARNPALADHLLAIATGRTLPALSLPDIDAMRGGAGSFRSRRLVGAVRVLSRVSRSAMGHAARSAG